MDINTITIVSFKMFKLQILLFQVLLGFLQMFPFQTKIYTFTHNKCTICNDANVLKPWVASVVIITVSWKGLGWKGPLNIL